MKIHDQHMVDIQNAPQSSMQGKHKGSYFATIGAVLVVILLIGMSVALFALWRGAKGPLAAAPPKGQWKAVLNGYTLSSLAAARNNPALLYACATRVNFSDGVANDAVVPYTIVHSTDFGNSWQEGGSSAALYGSCQLAVNPENSYDVYATGGSTNTSSGMSVALKHSTDGGKSWTTLNPMFHYPVPAASQQAEPWHVQNISVVGNTLFGTQLIEALAGPPVRSPGTPIPAIVYSLARLVSSTDGGQTWTIIDSNLNAQAQSTQDYIVDPTNAKTIYELVGMPWFPLLRTEPNDVLPNSYGTRETLYKTTDGGASWTPLLKDLSFGSEVQLASNNPSILYVGGSIGLMPRLPQHPGVGQVQSNGDTSSSTPVASGYGNFSLQVSQNAGMSWRAVSQPSQVAIQDWFVSANGQIYASSGFSNVGPGSGQGTALRGTPIVRTVVPTRVVGITEPTTNAAPMIKSMPTDSVAKIVRYDLASNAWQDMTKAPTAGNLVAVTASSDNTGAVLWLMSSEKMVLYRYVG